MIIKTDKYTKNAEKFKRASSVSISNAGWLKITEIFEEYSYIEVIFKT